MKKKAIILSGVSWNTTMQRHHTIANYLKQLDYDVIFIESITSSTFNFKKLYYRLLSKISRKEKKIVNPNNGIKILNYKFLNPMNNIFFYINKKKALRLIKEIGKDVDIIINYLPINTTIFIIDNLNYRSIIYDCVRDFENWGGYTSDININEKKMIEKSDLILTDSYYLTNKINQRYPDMEVKQLLPTVSKEMLEILRNSSTQKKIQNIVYFGQLGNHIDIDCLRMLSEKGYSIHIMGDISVELDFDYKYHGYFNNLNELAKTITRYGDAIIIPYKGNMDGVIPAKIMQSLATNLPVFINSFFDSKYLEQYLYVYENVEELFINLENFSLREHLDRNERIIEFLMGNLTENQFNMFKEYIKYVEE